MERFLCSSYSEKIWIFWILIKLRKKNLIKLILKKYFKI